jgi:hypothetical protein
MRGRLHQVRSRLHQVRSRLHQVRGRLHQMRKSRDKVVLLEFFDNWALHEICICILIAELNTYDVILSNITLCLISNYKKKLKRCILKIVSYLIFISLYFTLNLKIVGYLDNRDRLGHWWVAEMLLNAQSKLLIMTP